VAQSDSAIAGLSAEYDKIAASWRQWAQYRDYYVDALKREHGAQSAMAQAPAAVAEPAAVPLDSAVRGQVEVASGVVSPEAVPQPVDLVDAPAVQALAPQASAPQASAPLPAPASALPTQASDQTPPQPSAKVSTQTSADAPKRRLATAADALTAPVLLGVAGAALLIAAAVVFVALAWTTFSPATRGTIVLAVAVAVSALAVWVRRLGLTVTSGAIGVVAMGFAGAASIAFFRESGALGSFDIPAALLLACIAGVILARLQIPWVGPAAALALAGAAIGFTIAATDSALDADATSPGTATVRGIWVWTISGTVAASALAATRRVWRWQAARTVVTWSAVIWLSLVGVSVPVWMWGHSSVFADAIVGLLPVVALLVLARWWPRLTIGPAALILTLLPATAVDSLGGGMWQQMAASAVAVGVLLAAGPWAPRVVLWPLLIGISPAFLTVAVASTVYSLSITIARIVAGTYVPDTNMWAGVAALVGGLSIAQLRTWKLESPWLSPLTVVGAGMTVVGAGIASFGVAELTGPALYHSSVALVLTVVAGGLVAMTRAWADGRAQWVSAAGALGFLVTAIVHSVWGLAIAEFPLWLGLLIAIAPIVGLAIRGYTFPWWGLPWVTPALMATGAALVFRYDGVDQLAIVVAVAIAAVVSWTAHRLPERAHVPALAGLATGAALAVVPALGTIRGVAAALDLADVPQPPEPLWPVAVLVASVGLAAVRRWHISSDVARATSTAGASGVLLAAVGFATQASIAWADGRPGLPAVFTLGAAAGVALTVPLWRERVAAWTTGIGATALAVIGGLLAESDLALSDGNAGVLALVAIAAIGMLASQVRRFPQVVLAPAVVLTTGLAASLALRADVALGVAVAVAGIAAAMIVWIPWRARQARFAVLGAVPAFGCAAFAGGLGVARGFTTLASGVVPSADWTGEQLGIALGVLAIGAAAWRLPRLVPGSEAARTARVAFISAIVAADVMVTAAVAAAIGRADGSAIALQWAASAAAILLGAVIAWAMRRAAPNTVLTPHTRRYLRWFAIAWASFIGGLAIWHAFTATIAGVGAIAPVVVTIAALAAGWRWWPRAVALPITVLATLVPLALWHTDSVRIAVIALATTLIGAGFAWSSTRARPHVAASIVWGLVPAAVVAAVADVSAVIAALQLASAPVQSLFEFTLLSPWLAATVVVSAIGAAALPRLRPHFAALMLLSIFVAVAAVPATVACAVLCALSLVILRWGTRIGLSLTWAAITAAVSTVWALGEAWQLTVVGAVGVVVFATATLRQRGSANRWGVTWLPVASGLLLGALTSAFGFDHAVMPAAMAGVGAAAFAAGRLEREAAQARMPLVVGIATFVLTVAAREPAAAGVTLVVASVAWFALALLELRFARWLCALTASLGTAFIMFDAGLSAPEAYTAVPALAALALGVIHMREEPAVSSVVALGPGLALLLVPSYIALIAEPDSILRTAWLTVAMLALALVAVRMRWFAPVAATAVTAVVVALVQVVVGTNLVVRLVAFVVVGSLLLAFASWFERLKQLR